MCRIGDEFKGGDTGGADVDNNNANDMATPGLITRVVIAFHEAAHADSPLRTLGTAAGRASIVPILGVRFGALRTCSPTPSKPAYVESKILCHYAGGHAQRAVDARCAQWGCWHDDEQAAELLREFGVGSARTGTTKPLLGPNRAALVRDRRSGGRTLANRGPS